MKTWVEELRTSGPSDIILAIVGNKIDRYED
jgi:GTPase SAR1 family protein